MCVCVCVCVCVCELTHLGMLSLAIYLGDDPKQSLQFANGTSCLVHRGRILIHIQILWVGGVRVGVVSPTVGVASLTLKAVGILRDSRSLSRGRISRRYSLIWN